MVVLLRALTAPWATSIYIFHLAHCFNYWSPCILCFPIRLLIQPSRFLCRPPHFLFPPQNILWRPPHLSCWLHYLCFRIRWKCTWSLWSCGFRAPIDRPKSCIIRNGESYGATVCSALYSIRHYSYGWLTFTELIVWIQGLRLRSKEKSRKVQFSEWKGE